MNYKLESFVKKITSPVVIDFNGTLQEFPNGQAAYDHDYDKYYLVQEVKIIDNKICLIATEKKQIFDTSWCGEEQISFF